MIERRDSGPEHLDRTGDEWFQDGITSTVQQAWQGTGKRYKLVWAGPKLELDMSWEALWENQTRIQEALYKALTEVKQ